MPPMSINCLFNLGMHSKDSWTDLRTLTDNDRTMSMALASSTVNIGWVWRRYIASLPPRGG